SVDAESDDENDLDIKPVAPTKLSAPQTSSDKTAKAPKSRRKRNQSVEEVMDAFINSHLRRTSTPRSGCRRVPGNLFFANPAVPREGSDTYCCARCCRPPPPALECCDVCNPDIAKSLMTVADPPPETKRAPSQMQVPDENPTEWSTIDHGLREALEIWRDEEALARWGGHHMIGGRGILGDEQIKRIVPLARRGAIKTLENLKRHVPKWHYHDRYGPQIVDIILTAYPIVSEPQSMQAPASVASEAGQVPPPAAPPLKKPQAQMRCGVCGEPGHNSRNVLKCEKQKEKRQEMIKKAASEAALDPSNTPALPKRSPSPSHSALPPVYHEPPPFPVYQQPNSFYAHSYYYSSSTTFIPRTY
ncbi:hypothetical protein FRC07_007410, partial [Ceratobasidium sp. 392]